MDVAKVHLMEQTPVHEQHNPDLLRLIPSNAQTVVEVGCSSGAMAREYKKINSRCRYIGIEVVPQYAVLAQRHCDVVHELNIEGVDDEYIRQSLPGDCWVFGDSLEHLKDPWSLLAKIRRTISADGNVVACIPNAQHWSVQARLNCGEFRYEESGLLDKTHLRWFTRITIFEMFQQAGYQIVEAYPRIFQHPMTEKMIPSIKQMARDLGADPEIAAVDALPLQYVVRAIPA
jgi:ubiquinone/menaquinone biosynthesis C-methylase UbiE